MNFCYYQSTSISPKTSPSHWTSDKQTCLQSDTLSHFKPFPAQTYTLVSTSGTPSFCKGSKVMEARLKRSCLGALYMANSESIQNHCLFKIADARVKIFELSENTWAVYSVGTISTPTNRKPLRLRSRRWTGPARSRTSSTTGTRKQSTKQSRGSGPDTTGNSTLRSYLISWISSKLWIPTGLSHHQWPWSEQPSASSD